MNISLITVKLRGKSTLTIRRNGEAIFPNMCILCMKELVIVFSIVILRLNGNAAFSNMYNLSMKVLLIVVSNVTIRINKKKSSPTYPIYA